MSNIPAQVLLGTPKEATAYIYQIRAMRKASPTLVNTLNTAFAKQAYSWKDFKTGLTTSSPLAYGLAGAGTGGLLAALNEERKKKKHRNYSNILWGALTGGGLGAGGAYANKQIGPGGVSELLNKAKGKEEPHGAGAPTDEQDKLTKRTNSDAKDAKKPPGLIEQAFRTTESLANMAVMPGGELLDRTIGESGLNIAPGLANSPFAAGAATSTLLHGGASTSEHFGNKADLRNAARPVIRNEVKSLRNALPEAIRTHVAAKPIDMIEQIAEVKTIPAVKEVPYRAARPTTYKPHPQGGVNADGTPRMVVKRHGAVEIKYKPATAEIPGTPAKNIPSSPAQLRLQQVQEWIPNANPKELQRLIDGGTVQINNRPFTYKDLMEMTGESTIKPVPGGHQFQPDTLENLTGTRPMASWQPEWVKNLRRKLPGGRNVPPGVTLDVNARLGSRGDRGIDVPQKSWRGKFGRSPVTRTVAHAPWVIGMIMQAIEMGRHQGVRD
jgi:hypothetical protein